MTTKATRRTLARDISLQTGLSQRMSYEAIGAMLDSIAKTLADGGTAELRGFGTFWVNERAARKIVVPTVGRISVPKRKDVMFRPGEPLEKQVRKRRKKATAKKKRSSKVEK